MAVTVNSGVEYKPIFMTGLSTDTKPLTYSAPGNNKQDIPDRSEFLETDTGNTYVLYDSVWELTFSNWHQLIHNGQVFDIGYFFPSIANNGFADIIITPTNNIHIIPEFGCGGTAKVNIYRTPTYTGGTALGITNKNEESTKTTGATAVYSPSVTGVGTEIHVAGIMGGSGGNAGGAAKTLAAIHMLKGGLEYLFRIQNLSGVVQPAYIEIDYFEPLAL